MPVSRRCILALCTALALVASGLAQAGSSTVNLLLDLDRNGATGCTVNLAGGSMTGVERVYSALASTTTSSATVLRLERRICTGGVLGAPEIYDAGTWPVGMGNGQGGMAVIEASLPLAAFTPGVQPLARVSTDNGSGGEDVSASFNIVWAAADNGAVPVPLSPALLLALAAVLALLAAQALRRGTVAGRFLGMLAVCLVSGLVLAATAIRDGQIGDWAGVAPALTDPAGDAPPNADLVAVFFQNDANQLYLRYDLDVRFDGAAVNQAPQVNAGANQTITLPALANLGASATDDGLPNPPGALSFLWSQVSGPGTVTFGNATVLNTTASFSQAGNYTLRFTANDGALSSSADTQVTVSPTAPVAGPTLLPVANRNLTLGSRFQQILQATHSDANMLLSFALTQAPSGAGLSPAPLIDWTPTAAQLGAHDFTARVTDGNGQSASASFRVTVVRGNQAPVLAGQADATQPIGPVFSRTLSATDPDGDVLSYALVAGPPGMTLSGATLTWPTAARTPGEYTVTVRVSDPGGLSDVRTFRIRLLAAAAPLAQNDYYRIAAGQILDVPSLGVLSNDQASYARSLSAQKLSDPAAGNVSAFAADGGFTFQAPATPPGTPLDWQKQRNFNRTWSYGAHEVIGDLNGDGAPDIITHNLNADIRASSGADGTELWAIDTTGASDCTVMTNSSMNHRVLADIDDSGHPAYVFTTSCTRDGSVWADRIIAFDHLGKVKWVSPPVSKQIPEIRRNPTPVPPGGFNIGGLTWNRGLSVARLTAAGAPTLLMRAEITTNDGYLYYLDEFNAGHYAGCRAITGLVADENLACRATVLISGADGSVQQVLVAPNPTNTRISGGPEALKELPPIAFDVDGDGRVDLVSGGEVWKQNAGGGFDLAWQSNAPVNDTAVADLDGDGQAEILFLRSAGAATADRGLFIYTHNGTLLRHLPLQTYWFTPMTIADVDGDGRSDIVFGAEGKVLALRDDGRIIWTYVVPDEAPSDPIFGPLYTPATEGFRVSNSAAQVYDLDGDGIKEVIFAADSRIMVLDGRSGERKLDPYWTFSRSYNDVGTLALVDMNNDGQVDILQNAPFAFNCGFVGLPPGACDSVVGPVVMAAGTGTSWNPGPKAWHQLQYRASSIGASSQVLHDTTVARVFRTPEQQGSVVDPRLTQAVSFSYRAYDGFDYSAPADVVITIDPENRPPIFTSIPPHSLYQQFAPNPPGGLVTHYYQPAAYDLDPGDTVSYSLKSAPAWVTMDVGTGRIRFEPTCGSYGNPCNWGWTFVVLTATDSRGASTDQAFLVNLTVYAVTVPNVVGQPLAAAQATLLASDLQGVVFAEIFSAAPAGTVLAQEAVAGTLVGQFDDVRLTVSKGPAPVIMPDVVGTDLDAARARLEALGIPFDIQVQSSSVVPRNEVMAQAPAAGTSFVPAPGNLATLTVASSPLPAGTITGLLVEPGSAARLIGETVPLQATALFADGTATDVTLNVVWLSTAPAVASIDATGAAQALSAGSTQLRATLGAHSAEATLTVSTVLGDNVLPMAEIATPSDGSEVVSPVDVLGTASDANFLRYELHLASAGEEDWTLLAEGTLPVSNALLGRLDPTVLINGAYSLRLRAYDRGGNVAEALTSVVVRGERKVGLFTLGFTDLNAALSGVPITVTRTYDSRDKARGDFGIGWRLGLNTLRLRTNRVLGTGWTRTQSGISSSLSANGPHFVTVTLPDGRVETFDLVLAPMAGVGVLTSLQVTQLSPRPGTQGQLELLDNPGLLVLNDGARDVLVDDVTLEIFDPRHFRYTTLDGTKIEIDRLEGVKKVTDRNGNAITYGPNGILHSNGQGIVFARDALGRIRSITDLNGAIQTYQYDANGDLVGHTDATGAASTYAYDRRHNLIDQKNALGVSMTRNEYDAQGRLIRVIDAQGNPIVFTLNDAANEQLVTDRRGNVARLVYDNEGNVTRDERNVTLEGGAVLAVTTTAYDALGNETVKTNADGQRIERTFSGLLPTATRTDPAGLNLTTTFTYNAANEVTAATDPGGRVFAFSYDAAGNLTAAQLPGFGASTVTSNAQGQPTERIDALGNRTAMSYDAAGRLIREEIYSGASLLRRMEWSWDGNGNKLSETLYRTIGAVLTPLTTTMAYDAANRLIRRTDPAGGVTRWEYDAAGRNTAIIDALGRRSTHTYDTLGRKTRSDHPDGTFETTSFDAENNIVSETDRAGRTTTHVYDELNRRIRSTGPDGAVTQTLYSAGGRLMATIDARGNRTDFTYDAAGRRLSTQAPAVPNGPGGPLARPTVTQTLNSLGQPLTRSDPLARVTSFEYDAQGRLTKTTHPEGSFATQTWDALGRRSSATNEEGQTTNYSYDALGRLIGVSGFAGSATYAYDEAGNLLSETDALGRSTTYQYDTLNRLTQRQYPGGETTRFAYDAVGNLVARTDGMGRVIGWAYDTMNRPISKTLPGGVTVATTYRPDGQRASVTDPRGVTHYSYDTAGRLASVTHPTGEVLSYSYDADGNLTALTSPAGTQTYSYDALARLSAVAASEGSATLAYDLAGNRLRQTLANGIISEASYDNRNRPVNLAHKLGATVLQSYTTAWSPASRRTSITEADGSVESYSYDSRGRLAGANRSGTGPLTLTMAYDAVGNRTQLVRNGSTTNFSYDLNDRLSGDGSASYSYDANGNLVSRSEGASVTNYAWSAEDRLIGVSATGVNNQYVYDADGRRVAANTNAGNTRFLVDARNPTGLAQVLEEREASSGNLAARYTIGRELLTMERGGTASSLLADPLGSVRALTSAAGNITDTYRFDPYGNVQAASGSTVNPIGWRGERVEESGLVDLRARMYSPATGRFLSRDPFEGRAADPVSRHRYLYAHADPVNSIDPSGTTTLTELTFVQGVQSILRVAQSGSEVAKACGLLEGAKEVGNAVALLQIATAGAALAAQAGLAVQAASGGKGMAVAGGFETEELPEPGLKKLGIHLQGSGGQLGVAFSFDFHNGALGLATLNLMPPPVRLDGVIGGGIEYLIKEFKVCGTVTAGRVVAKGSMTGGASAVGGGIYGTHRAAVDIEANLLRGGLKFQLPFLEYSFGATEMSMSMFGGLLPIFNVPHSPN